MTLAVVVTDRDSDQLCQQLSAMLPHVEIQQWPDIGAPEEVEFAVLWQHPVGITKQFPRLKAVTSLGAGTDHMDKDTALSGLPQHRIVTDSLKQLMAQFVLLHVLSDARHQLPYYLQQHKKQWQVLEQDEPMKTVGFIGLGALGSFVADRCADMGFRVLAWTAQSEHEEYPCYHGDSGLKQVIGESDYVVLLLPLSDQTRHIINERSLTWFKKEATLINVARGAHVDEAALCQALSQGHLKHAVLDVFEQEPLPESSPLWDLENITITPHISARSDAGQTALAIVELFNNYVSGYTKS